MKRRRFTFVCAHCGRVKRPGQDEASMGQCSGRRSHEWWSTGDEQ